MHASFPPKCQSALLRVGQKVHMRLFLYRYSCLLKYIKNDIRDKVMPIFEAWKLPPIKLCALERYPSTLDRQYIPNGLKIH